MQAIYPIVLYININWYFKYLQNIDSSLCVLLNNKKSFSAPNWHRKVLDPASDEHYQITSSCEENNNIKRSYNKGTN